MKPKTQKILLDIQLSLSLIGNALTVLQYAYGQIQLNGYILSLSLISTALYTAIIQFAWMKDCKNYTKAYLIINIISVALPILAGIIIQENIYTDFEYVITGGSFNAFGMPVKVSLIESVIGLINSFALLVFAFNIIKYFINQKKSNK
ncbi:MAG: hypothetical protein ACI4IG_01280 [Eubacterium sp.]